MIMASQILVAAGLKSSIYRTGHASMPAVDRVCASPTIQTIMSLLPACRSTISSCICDSLWRTLCAYQFMHYTLSAGGHLCIELWDGALDHKALLARLQRSPHSLGGLCVEELALLVGVRNAVQPVRDVHALALHVRRALHCAVYELALDKTA